MVAAPGETDRFKVYLYSPDTAGPDLPLAPLDLAAGQDYFFYWDSGAYWNSPLYNTDYVTVEMPFSGVKTVCLNVSEWADQEVRLVFALEHDFTDGETVISIYDVGVELGVPVDPTVINVGDTVLLWPPNHKYHTIKLSDCVDSIIDTNGQEISVDEQGQIVSIYSDEPEDASDGGDGATADDIVILDHANFKVRAERQGSRPPQGLGNGRVYGVTFKVVDSTGAEITATGYVGVPHDMSGKNTGDTAPIDDGPDPGYTVWADPAP